MDGRVLEEYLTFILTADDSWAEMQALLSELREQNRRMGGSDAQIAGLIAYGALQFSLPVGGGTQ